MILDDLPSKFTVFYILLKTIDKKLEFELVSNEEFMRHMKKCRIIICLKKNGNKIKQLLLEDSFGKLFGQLQSLICANDLKEMYKSPQRHKLVQIRYNFYKGKRYNFMRQICYYNKELETNIKKDLEKYKAIASKLDIEIDYTISNKLVAVYMPDIMAKGIWKIIDLFM